MNHTVEIGNLNIETLALEGDKCFATGIMPGYLAVPVGQIQGRKRRPACGQVEYF
jgi:hypothetical protein